MSLTEYEADCEWKGQAYVTNELLRRIIELLEKPVVPEARWKGKPLSELSEHEYAQMDLWLVGRLNKEVQP